MTITDIHTETLEHLNFQPRCSARTCQHGHPPATHALRPANGTWCCHCGDQTILLCHGCTRHNADFWSWTTWTPATCASCSWNGYLIPAREGQVTPL